MNIREENYLGDNMKDLSRKILETSIAHFRAHIEKHKMNVEVLLKNGVGVAEHPDVMETIEKELTKVAHYRDLLEEAQMMLEEM